MGNGDNHIVVRHESMEFMKDRVASTAQKNMDAIGDLIQKLEKERHGFNGEAALAFDQLKQQYNQAQGEMGSLLNRQGLNIDEAGQRYTATDRQAASYF